MASLYSLIESRFPSDRDRTLLEVPGGRTYSWRELSAQTEQIAAFLTALGLVRGDRVAVKVEKSPDALFLYLACLRQGLIYLPMNPAYQKEEVDYILGDATPALLVHRPEDEILSRELATRHGIAHRKSLGVQGDGTLLNEAGKVDASAIGAPLPCAADEVACILYTSGTTGRPKGAMLTHGNLTANALDLVKIWGFTDQDTLIHALPLFHVHGLFVACHCVLISGAKLIWLQKFDEAEVVRLLAHATVLMGVPTFYTRLLLETGLPAEPAQAREACVGMRLFISGSAPLRAETFREFRERSGFEILERYGMTETGMNTSNPLLGERRPGTVGFPLPGVLLRITRDGDFRDAEEIGGIEVKGANVFKGYWGKPEKGEEDFTPDGWFRTGDEGKIDWDGYVQIVGRAKDLIITGGYNVYPKEVELVIDGIPGVVESTVIGIAHPDLGEAVTAVVKREPGADTVTEMSIITALKARIANYKIPKRVHFLDELPRNAMGKVQKKLLRERFSASSTQAVETKN